MNSIPRRILFVDDHQDTLDLFAMALSHDNYDVVTGATVTQALQQAQTQQFDLLILDALLPDGSGLELCRIIRQTDQSTPILFCSGLSSKENQQEAMGAGAQGYLVKPVSIAAMREAILRLIPPPRAEAAGSDRSVLNLTRSDSRPSPAAANEQTRSHRSTAHPVLR